MADTWINTFEKHTHTYTHKYTHTHTHTHTPWGFVLHLTHPYRAALDRLSLFSFRVHLVIMMNAPDSYD
jgi:hypothetical protein